MKPLWLSMSRLRLSIWKDLESTRALADRFGLAIEETSGHGKLIMELFEELVEDRIEQPVFHHGLRRGLARVATTKIQT